MLTIISTDHSRRGQRDGSEGPGRGQATFPEPHHNGSRLEQRIQNRLEYTDNRGEKAAKYSTDTL